MSKPNFRTSKPQTWEQLGVTHCVTYAGKCVVCGTRVYDGMGAAHLEHNNNALVAEEYDKQGPDVPLCFYCANEERKYKQGLEIAMSRWTDKLSPVGLEAHNLIFKMAVSSGDGFRQYVYPHLPASYTFNPAIDAEIERLASEGIDAQTIADEIYKAHA